MTVNNLLKVKTLTALGVAGLISLSVIGCGTSSSSGTSTTTTNETNIVSNETSTNVTSTNETSTTEVVSKATILGNVTAIKNLIDLVNGDYKAETSQPIKDVVARVNVDGNIQYFNGYFIKNGNDLFLEIPNVPVNSTVSIIFVNDKLPDDTNVTSVDSTKIVAMTPDVEVTNSSVEVFIESVDLGSKLAKVKIKEGATIPKIFELVNTNIKTASLSNPPTNFVDSLNVSGDEVHLYAPINPINNESTSTTAISILAISTTNPGNSNYISIPDVAAENYKDGKYYILRKLSTGYVAPGVVDITKDETGKIQLVPSLYSTGETDNNVNNYEMDDDYIYAGHYAKSKTESLDSTVTVTVTASTKTTGENPATDSAKKSVFSAKVYSWDYNGLERNKKQINVNLTAKVTASAEGKKGKGTLELYLNGNKLNGATLKTTATLGKDVTAVTAKAEKNANAVKMIELSSYNLKDIYDGDVYVYAIINEKLTVTAKTGGTTSSTSKVAVVAAKFDLDNPSKNAAIKIVEDDASKNVAAKEVIACNTYKYVVVLDNGTLYEVDFSQNSLSKNILKTTDNKPMTIDTIKKVKMACQGDVLAIGNTGGSTVYVCNLKSPDKCLKAAISGASVSKIDIIYADDQYAYILVQDSDTSSKTYAIKYDIANNKLIYNNKDNKVDPLSSNIYGYTFIRSIDNPDVFVGYSTKQVALLNFADGEVYTYTTNLNTINSIAEATSKGLAIVVGEKPAGTNVVDYLAIKSGNEEIKSGGYLNGKLTANGNAVVLVDTGKAYVYYKCDPITVTCSQVSNITFVNKPQVLGSATDNNFKVIDYQASKDPKNPYTIVYLYDVTNNLDDAIINTQSIKVDNITNVIVTGINALNPDILLMDNTYYYYLKQLLQ